MMPIFFVAGRVGASDITVSALFTEPDSNISDVTHEIQSGQCIIAEIFNKQRYFAFSLLYFVIT